VVVEYLAPYVADFDEAVSITQHRRLADTPLKRELIDIADRYNGDFVVPVPDMPGEPTFPALSAAVIIESIDSAATRSNDTDPMIAAPPMRSTVQSAKDKANLRRKAWRANWAESQIDLKLAKAYRRLYGYGTFTLVALPDFEEQRVRILNRDPLVSYPEALDNDEIRSPNNCGFIYGRTPGWLIRKFPEAREHIEANTDPETDDLWDVLEWMDDHCTMIGLLGRRQPRGPVYSAPGQLVLNNRSTHGDTPLDHVMLLRRWDNRAGVCPVVCPAQASLDRMVAALTKIVPITDLMNKLAALDFMAAEQTVMPVRFALGAPDKIPSIVGGRVSDGRDGQINLLENVQNIMEFATAQSPATAQLQAQLERVSRLAVGNPSLLQGELSGSLRSGQTVDALAGVSIDPRIKEGHKIMSYALSVMNDVVAESERGYWPTNKYVVFSGQGSDAEHITYTPADIWEPGARNVVTYPIPGMDATQAAVTITNLNAAGLMSRATARARHPLIEDGPGEEQGVTLDRVRDMVNMATLKQVEEGNMALTDLVRWEQLIEDGMTPPKALVKVQEEAQERQANAPAPVAPPAPIPLGPAPGGGAPMGELGPGAGPGGPIAPPESMPGINNPMAGGQAPMPPGGGGAPGGPGIEELLAALSGGGGGV